MIVHVSARSDPDRVLVALKTSDGKWLEPRKFRAGFSVMETGLVWGGPAQPVVVLSTQRSLGKTRSAYRRASEDAARRRYLMGRQGRR